MIAVNRILLTTDFSEYAAAANNYACALADQFSAELHVVHVIENYIPTFPLYGVDTAPPVNLKELKTIADEKLANLLDRQWLEGKRVVYTTILGNPFVEIINYAKQHTIDLIVMSTHGRTGLSHVLIGSVAEKVVRKAPCPVLTVHPDGHQFVMP